MMHSLLHYNVGKTGECDITERQIISSVTWHDNIYIGLPVCEHDHNIWPEQ